MASVATAPWSCGLCTYWHEGEEATSAKCAICGARRGEVPPDGPVQQAPPPEAAVAAAAPAAAAASVIQPAAPPPPTTTAPRLPSAAVAPVVEEAPREALPADVPEPPPRCVWLAAEGLRLEARAAELDRAGSSAEAAFHHRRAADKLSDAAALCPDGHPDGPRLREHVLEVSARAVYLDSLAGAPPSMPLEDHVGEVSLLMDLSSAPRPEDEEVSALIAKSGTSGSSAALSEAGYRLVAALENPAEMRVYANRIIAADGRRRASSSADADVDATLRAASSFDGLQQAIRGASWVELDIDLNMDRLDLGNKFAEEGASLEAQGRREEAAQMYSKAVAALQFAYKYDERSCRYPKVKEAIGKKVEELSRKASASGAR